MWKEMEKESKYFGFRTLDNEEDRNLEGLQDALLAFRSSVLAEAERPNAFWAKQGAGITERLRKPLQAKKQPVLVWIPAAIITLLCVSLFLVKPNPPAVAFAGGADQQLLVEVERALSRKYPDALAPAAILSQEIESNNRHGRR
jgi:hypothetical protein